MVKEIGKYLLYIFFLFLSFELFIYFLFPDFRESKIYYTVDDKTKVSMGIKNHYKIYNELRTRVKNENSKINFNHNNNLWIIGDSVTDGYGVEFNDTFYSVLNSYLKTKGVKTNIFAISFYADSTINNIGKFYKIKNLINENDFLIYQFNFNDIVPFSNNENIRTSNTKNILRKIIHKTNKFRYKYLTHSVFFKFLFHHAGIFIRNTSGSCTERGLDALGPYTYTYFGKGFEEDSYILWENFKKNILEIKQVSNELNIKFLFLISPISLQLENHYKTNKLNYDVNCSTEDPRQYLINFLQENDINFVDPIDLFIKYEKKYQLFFNYDVNHPNKLGHELIAKSIYNNSLIKIHFEY